MGLIQGTAGDTVNVTSKGLALGSNVTAGSLLVVGASVSDIGAVTLSIANTGTAVLSAWSKFAASDQFLTGLGTANAYYATVTTGGTCTCTITSSGRATIALSIGEFAGPWAATPLDGTLKGTASGTSAAPAAASFTPGAGDLVVSFMTDSNGAETQGLGTNYIDGTTSSLHQLRDGSGAQNVDIEWWVDAAGAATTGNWSIASAAWLLLYACFKSGGFLARSPIVICQAVKRASFY